MTTSVEFHLPKIESELHGFATLVNLAEQISNLEYTPITLNMAEATWVDANMCAPLGAVLYQASRRSNSIWFANIPAPVRNIFQKNSFLSYYGQAKKTDAWGTTIQYQRFERKDDRFFGSYIQQQFENKAMPEMSPALRKKFWESIFELFSNAVIHSEAEMGIFTCGQYFPKRNRIDFTIADLGIGIPRNLMNKKGLKYAPEMAINWAMEGRNTTRTGSIPGGLGLKLLREFIRVNQGRIQVVSDVGYWEQCSDGTVNKQALPNPFPGTVVNIEINTADMNSYVLSTETPQDIF